MTHIEQSYYPTLNLQRIVFFFVMILLICTPIDSTAQIGKNSFGKGPFKTDTSKVNIDTINTSLSSKKILQNPSIKIKIDTTTKDSIHPKVIKTTTIYRYQYPIIDSFSIHTYHDSDVDGYLKIYNDTTLTFDTHSEDMTRRDNNNYLHLGNTGSSATPMAYQVANNINNDIGYHNFDFFNRAIDSFQYYKVFKPYSRAYFHTGINKKNFSNGIIFANNYLNNIYLTVDFRRIIHQGLYLDQKTRNSDFNTGIHWDQNRYQLYLHFFNRTNTEEINGGIVPNINFDAPANSIRKNIKVNLANANSRQYLSGIKIKNKYLLLGGKKNCDNCSSLDLIHQFRYTKQVKSYFDEKVNSKMDLLYYKALIDLNDRRGIRLYLTEKNLSNSLGIRIAKTKLFSIKASIRHQFIKYNDDNKTNKYNNIDLLSSATFSIYKWKTKASLQLNLKGHKNASNLYAISSLEIGKKLGTLSVSIQNLRKQPSYIQQNLVLNRQEVWQNNFEVQTSNIAGANYHNKYLKTKISYKYIVLSNHIYLDSNLRFRQHKPTITIHQLQATQRFKLWRFYFYNEVLYQNISNNNNTIALPELYTRNELAIKLYDQSKKEWFLGGNIRYFVSEKILKDQLVLGAFYPTNEEFIDYWTTEIYTSARIATLELYIKYRNFEQLFDKKIDYQIQGNPQFDGTILFGINWRFEN